MARQTTKRTVETPEGRADYMQQLMRECGTLREEIDRLNSIITYKNTIINSLQKANEQISDELSKVRNQ